MMLSAYALVISIIALLILIIFFAFVSLLEKRTVALRNAEDKIVALSDQLQKAESDFSSEITHIKQDCLAEKRLYKAMKDYYEHALRDLDKKGLIEFETPKLYEYDKPRAEMYTKDKLYSLTKTPYSVNI